MDSVYWVLEIAACTMAILWLLEKFLPGLYTSVARLIIDDITWAGVVTLYAVPIVMGFCLYNMGVTPSQCVSVGVGLGAFIRVYPALAKWSSVKETQRVGMVAILLLFVAGYHALAGFGYGFASNQVTGQGMLGRVHQVLREKGANFLIGVASGLIVNKYGRSMGRNNSPLDGGGVIYVAARKRFAARKIGRGR